MSSGAGPAAYPVARALEKVPYQTWVEPFLGRGDVFRAVSPKGPAILNDLDCARTSLAEKKACSVSSGKCELIRSADVSCGKDWTSFLKHDSPQTLFFLDPPWKTPGRPEIYRHYSKSTPVDPAELVRRTRDLKGAVAIYYADRPETRRELCRPPFRCRMIQRSVFNQHFTQLLAIKPPRGSAA